MTERILTKNKFSSSYIVGKADKAMNAEGDIFAFEAFISDDDLFCIGDGVLFDRVSYEIIEFKGKKKELTSFYAKAL